MVTTIFIAWPKIYILFLCFAAAFRRFEEQIRVLQEDLESEMQVQCLRHFKEVLLMFFCLTVPVSLEKKEEENAIFC
jgi:hypothetical protein